MKCQKCGRNEVNFHYTSDVNGQVTQMHLCSDCAEQSGYNIDQMFGDMFTGMFPMRKQSSFLPFAIPVLQIGSGFAPARQTEHTCKCGCSPNVSQTEVEVDEKLKQRRELNQQMRIAAENEDFEKAAELRDKIKELEA
ncbi:MAG: UvrB/UvrC motif-containing protein [Oscillospiraceae bacterium]|nr:UvrB/UvrC motif-containing protein [Oscillospiraceae bacterium]